MPFPRIYVNQTCPLEGYEAYTLRILANPTGAEKTAWAQSFLTFADSDFSAFGAAAVPILGETRAEGLDFSTAEAGAATLSSADLPDELADWILQAPGAVWAARSEDIKKKLMSA